VDELRELYEARAAQQYAEPTPLPDPRMVVHQVGDIVVAVAQR
jgi:hypothetical protein